MRGYFLSNQLVGKGYTSYICAVAFDVFVFFFARLNFPDLIYGMMDREQVHEATADNSRLTAWL